MRTYILTLMALLMALPVTYSQITVDNSSFFAIGDTLRLAESIEPDGISMANSGEDQVWDLTSLIPDTTYAVVVKDATLGADYASFPTAELLIPGPFGDSYVDVTNDAMSILGFAASGFAGFPIAANPAYSPPLVEQRAPIAYFDVHTPSAAFYIAISTMGIPDSAFAGFPVKPDSIRVAQNIDRLDVVDGWGMAKIPGGEYEVLRERRRTIIETTVEVQVIGVWLDLASFGIPLPGLGVDTTLNYYFYAKDEKGPIAIVEVDPEDESEVLAAQFKDNGTTSVFQPQPFDRPLVQGPNPTSGTLRVDLSPVRQEVELTLIGLSGQVLERYTLQGGQSHVLTMPAYLGQGAVVYQIHQGRQLLESGRLLLHR